MALKPKPKSIILKTDLAKEINEFRTVLPKHATLSSIIGKEETKSLWFSFDQIQEMWDEMIYQMVNNRKNVSGIRVYLTTYLAASKNPKQLGVAFVMTENIGSADKPKHKDFFIEEQADYSRRPEAFIDPTIESVDNFDHGTPCPPECSGVQDPEWP